MRAPTTTPLLLTHILLLLLLSLSLPLTTSALALPTTNSAFQTTDRRYELAPRGSVQALVEDLGLATKMIFPRKKLGASGGDSSGTSAAGKVMVGRAGLVGVVVGVVVFGVVA